MCKWKNTYTIDIKMERVWVLWLESTRLVPTMGVLWAW